VIFKSNDQGVPQGDLNGFLDRGSRLEGELRFETSFRIDGRVSGRVTSPGSLIVGDGGEVEGEIEVGRLFVSGVLRGTVKAAARIHIAPGGKVYADLVTPSLVIEDGAVFEGRCAMTGEPRGVGERKGKPAEEAAKPKLVPKAAG
jgi:cytoskeletal protein CcmA (bactofilin family)